ncbi:melanin-concentrating hormone receptor 1-like isoform X2 [Engystomops pustulosus]|uniref:melanin-concentrating hormone receptor 1-like isoform X2 n=1 Tax=Engystomops pustulosus TaxID=76066 RepID=UPI003AFB4E3F
MTPSLPWMPTSLPPASGVVSLRGPGWGVVYGMICGCGVLCNGLVLAVLLSCRQTLVSDLYVVNLALADLLSLLGMPLLIHQLLHDRGWVFGDILCRAVTALDLNNQITGVGIITALCVDRYVAVVHSSTVGQRRSVRCTWIVTGCVWLCSLLLSVPVLLYSGVRWGDGVALCVLDLPGAPPSLYWVMRRVQRAPSQRSRRVTRMALAIVAAFLFCWAPFHAVQLVNLFSTGPPSTSTFYLNQAAICLGYAHSCVSPLLVICCTEGFRERLPHARCCRFLFRRWAGFWPISTLPHNGPSSAVNSPPIDGMCAPQHRRRTIHLETPPCSITESTRISLGIRDESSVL